jgi:1-acyl-sn-glycerol-3-phosphate acyltransferase
MIEASRSALFERMFGVYNKRLLRNAFASIRVAGAEHVRALDRTRPIILIGNHSCWWDGLIEYFLSRSVFGFEPFLMMDERQMQKYRFFRFLGTFSVNRHSPREARQSIGYAVRLFDRPNRVLWIYPQGVMCPNDMRPLRFERGAAVIATSLRGAQVVPLVHRYEFLREQRPDAFIRFGAAIPVHASAMSRSLTTMFESTVTSGLDSLRKDIVEGKVESFDVVLTGRRSTNESYDAVRLSNAAGTMRKRETMNGIP